jgi:hypothetical protein
MDRRRWTVIVSNEAALTPRSQTKCKNQRERAAKPILGSGVLERSRR